MSRALCFPSCLTSASTAACGLRLQLVSLPSCSNPKFFTGRSAISTGDWATRAFCCSFCASGISSISISIALWVCRGLSPREPSTTTANMPPPLFLRSCMTHEPALVLVLSLTRRASCSNRISLMGCTLRNRRSSGRCRKAPFTQTKHLVESTRTDSGMSCIANSEGPAAVTVMSAEKLTLSRVRRSFSVTSALPAADFVHVATASVSVVSTLIAQSRMSNRAPFQAGLYPTNEPLRITVSRLYEMAAGPVDDSRALHGPFSMICWASVACGETALTRSNKAVGTFTCMAVASSRRLVSDRFRCLSTSCWLAPKPMP